MGRLCDGKRCMSSRDDVHLDQALKCLNTASSAVNPFVYAKVAWRRRQDKMRDETSAKLLQAHQTMYRRRA